MARRGKRATAGPATRVEPPGPVSAAPMSEAAGEGDPAATAVPEPAVTGGADVVALERERWLRRQIDRDRELLIWFGRGLLQMLAPESTVLRFWRWLIDDLRSERRQQAALLGQPVSEGLLADRGVRLPTPPNPLPWIVRSWRSRRRRR
jgi:hypothetical protein